MTVAKSFWKHTFQGSGMLEVLLIGLVLAVIIIYARKPDRDDDPE
jgi:hypothetical protein